MTGQGLELEVPSQTRDVRQGSLNVLGDLVDALDDLEVVDEGDVAHQDLSDRGDGGGVVDNGGLIDLVDQLGLHLEERLQRSVFTGRDSVDQPEEDLALTLVGQEVLNGETSVGLITGRVISEPLELSQDIVALALGDDDETTVDLLAVLESSKLDVGDDTEVVAATLQGLEEVGVLVLVSVDDLARGQDDLEVEDGVGDETVFSRKPSDGSVSP